MTNYIVTSVWSTYGHRFLSTDTPDKDQCMTCGAVFELRPNADAIAHYEDPASWDIDDYTGEPIEPDVVQVDGDYTTWSGDDPSECTGLTTLVHGYEAACMDCDDPDECTHLAVEHGCNCLYCTG